MAIKMKKEIVDLETELNAELTALGFEIVYNPDGDKKEEKETKETIKKDRKTTKKK